MSIVVVIFIFIFLLIEDHFIKLKEREKGTLTTPYLIIKDPCKDFFLYLFNI